MKICHALNSAVLGLMLLSLCSCGKLTVEETNIIATETTVPAVEARITGPEIDVAKLVENDATWTLNGQPFTGVALRHSTDGKTLLARWEIKEGKFHGLIEEWWDNGNKNTETNFVNGKRHGENRYWYMDGEPQKLQVYEHGTSVSEVFY